MNDGADHVPRGPGRSPSWASRWRCRRPVVQRPAQPRCRTPRRRARTEARSRPARSCRPALPSPIPRHSALREPLGVRVKVRIPTVTVGTMTLRSLLMFASGSSECNGQGERVGDADVGGDLAEWCAGCVHVSTVASTRGRSRLAGDPRRLCLQTYGEMHTGGRARRVASVLARHCNPARHAWGHACVASPLRPSPGVAMQADATPSKSLSRAEGRHGHDQGDWCLASPSWCSS